MLPKLFSHCYPLPQAMRVCCDGFSRQTPSTGGDFVCGPCAASSAGSGRQGGSLSHRAGLSSVPAEASAGEATSLHSGDSTGLSRCATSLRKRGRPGGGNAGAASKRPSRAAGDAVADGNAAAALDCSQQV